MNNQDDRHDGSKDGLDPKLQQLYRQLPKEQPSKELDAKILATAKITKPDQSLKKSRPWQAPFALAASLVMVSSVVLYLHEENPAVFEVQTKSTQAPTDSMPMPATTSISEPTPDAGMAKPIITNEANVTDIASSQLLADKKVSTQKAKDAPITKPEEAKIASARALDDIHLTALAEKKADMASRADQVAQSTLANQSAKFLQSATMAKEIEARQSKTETDQLYAAAPAPAPMVAPALQMQSQPEIAELRSQKAGRLQDSNHASRQLSAASIESDKPAELEKSNSAPAFTSAAPMSLGAVAGLAMPTSKQSAKRDEIKTRADYVQSISAPILSIENVAIGMSRDQLVAQGLTCYVDVCHLELSQPHQESYWGMPASNAHLTAFLSRQVVTKLVLQQKIAQLNQVKTALSNVGIASQQSCVEEKGTLLIGRQLGANIFNVRSMAVGLSLSICQQTKSLK